MQFLLTLVGLWLLGGENAALAFTATTAPSLAGTLHKQSRFSSISPSLQQLSAHQVSIEYCTGCRWGLRAFWFAQELLSTFQNDAGLSAVTLIPSRPSDTVKGGRFVVKCHNDDDDGTKTTSLVLWNREDKGSFPEPKQLKQLVRDVIDPEMYLGHSDTAKAQEAAASAQKEMGAEVIDLTTEAPERKDATLNPVDIQNSYSPNVAITYCTGCRWLLRAAYYGQDLLTTFDSEINSLTLIPSRPPAKGGSFAVHVDGDTVLWDRFVQGRFPESKELKQLLRDQLNPSKDLGHHIDGSASGGGGGGGGATMGEDEAEKARTFFGVG